MNESKMGQTNNSGVRSGATNEINKPLWKIGLRNRFARTILCYSRIHFQLLLPASCWIKKAALLLRPIEETSSTTVPLRHLDMEQY